MTEGVRLLTPPLPRLVPAGVFDAFGWMPSDWLLWRCARTGFRHNQLEPDLPVGMAFVLHEPWELLPTELAWLHVGKRGYDLGDAVALAPYGIDDATDLLWEHRRRARDVLWLAADNLNALHWALHDWAHFHNHGPFEERTATELQCDASALAWLWLNRELLGLEASGWRALHAQVSAFHTQRCEREPPGVPLDNQVLTDANALRSLAESLVQPDQGGLARGEGASRTERSAQPGSGVKSAR